MNELEEELTGRIDVVRVNVDRPVGRILGERLGASSAPTLILLDGDGVEVWRKMGFINRDEVFRQVEALVE